MQKIAISSLFTLAVFLLLLAEPAIAGPGGKIASAVFETFWGRIILGVQTIFFLPLITSLNAVPGKTCASWLQSARLLTG